jgi:hypothetical protein
MLDGDDWCLVQWHDHDSVMVRRKYQWEAQGKHYPHKWKYIAEGLTAEQAENYSKLFKGAMIWDTQR